MFNFEREGNRFLNFKKYLDQVSSVVMIKIFCFSLMVQHKPLV